MSALKNFHRGRGRKYMFLGATLVAAAAFSVVFVAASGAAPTPCPIPGNFEIDGDMTQATCDPAADDWNTPGLQVAQTNQGGTYSTSHKDDSDPSAWTSTGSTPNKTDFAQAYATSRVVNGHFFVFVAWERTDTTGTQGYAIEVTNAGSNVGADGSPQPIRGGGGSVFYISSQGSSAPAFNEACSYSSQSDYGQTCTVQNSSVTMAINTVDMTDTLNPATIPAGGFFEVALDVTGLTGVTPSCPGAAANAVYLRSITGQTKNGNLKGYMAPLEVAPDSTCVPPPMTTTATPGGSLADIGSAQHDTVTVGTAQAPGVGTVKFFLCSPAEVTANGGDCKANGTQIGSAVTLNGSGNGTSATVDGSTTPNTNATGKYCWRAEFTPGANDHNYLAGSHTNSTTECFTIVAPSLSITKTADATTVDAGDPIGFTITVSNGGPGNAKNVTLDDPLPAGSGVGVTWSIDSGPSGDATPTCSISNGSPQELTCSGVDLGSGKSYSLHVTATTSFDECTTYDNTATASADNAPDASDEADITCNKPDLGVTKTADATLVSAGDPIGFTITVSNAGPGVAKNVTLDDPLPAGSGAGVTWSIDSGPSGDVTPTCSISNASPQELTCSAVDLGAGKSYSLHITATTSVEECTEYDNTATASADNAPDASDEADIACSLANVSITKTADHSAPVHAGDQIGFTVEVENTGVGDATGVVLNDPLPAGSGSGVTWSIDQSTGTPAQFVLSGAVGSQTLSLASSTLPAGADYTVHLVASTSQTECSKYDNTATLTTDNANNPDPAKASESCAFRVDLSVTKSGSPATQTLGDGNITWTIVVTNNGPDIDTNVKIADPMPAGNTFVSVTTSKGSCTGGAILACNLGTLAAGESVTITLVTTPSTVGAQTNVVNVVGDRPETNTANNTATATVQTVGVVTPPVLCVAVSKVTPKQLFVGRKTKLTIHVTQGGKAVKGVHVRIKGAKINMKTGASNSSGVIKQTLKLKKAGILVFSPIASKKCNTKRVGVTNVFTPPVTG